MGNNKIARIIILNTHSTLNSGDLAIVLAQIQYFKKHFPGSIISLTSRTPENDKFFYRKLGAKVFREIEADSGLGYKSALNRRNEKTSLRGSHD